jgi:hypothetical protein
MSATATVMEMMMLMMKSLQGNSKQQTQLPLQTNNLLFGFLLWQSKKPILLHQQHLCNNNTKTLRPAAAASPQFFFFFLQIHEIA